MTRDDRRTLFGILGFLAGLALGGPLLAVVGACAGTLTCYAMEG
jgi:hypothetical protein